MTSLLQDFRFSLRLLAKSPGFAAAAITVLALGIGLNTAIFSLTYALAFSPRPFAAPDRIVQLYTRDLKKPDHYRPFSYPLYREIAARQDLFAGVFAHSLAIVGVGEKAGTRRALSTLITANYFDTLGVKLARGRAFTSAEERPGAGLQVAIASYQYWKKNGFDPGLVGSTLRVNERPFTIVGITPAGFSGTMMLVGPELYFPLGTFDLLSDNISGQERRALERADTYRLNLIARLADGVSLAKAGAALTALAPGLEQRFPAQFKDQTLVAGPLRRIGNSPSPANGPPLALIGLLLLGLAGGVLLVVCLNLAGLLFARGQARTKEFAIRLALGSGRARLVRQLCIEGLVLAGAGGGLGLLLASQATALISAMMNARLPFALFVADGSSPAIIAATVVFCVLATLMFALGPALRFSRNDVVTDLKGHAGEDPAVRRRRWLPRHPLLVGQIALSLTLLVAASLFFRMARQLTAADTGYHADNTILVEMDAALGGFSEVQSRDLYHTIQEKLAALPGVAAVAPGALAPYGFDSASRSVRRAGAEPAPDAIPTSAAEGLAFTAGWNAVGADYFSVMGLPLLRGRAFTPAEAAEASGPAVVVIDEALARQLWPEGDALGQRIQFASSVPSAAPVAAADSAQARRGAAPAFEVVGIVRATRLEIGQSKAGPALYVPFAQGFRANAFFHIRPAHDNAAAALALLDPVRRTVLEAAPGLPLFKVQTFSQHLASNLDLWIIRLSSALFFFFGSLSVFVAVVGIYGVYSYAVSRRTREVGIRMALGAQPGTVLAMILREGAAVTLTGIGLGLLLSIGLGRIMAASFTDMEAFNSTVFLGVTVAFTLAALLACWFPARRATRVNPLVALRSE